MATNEMSDLLEKAYRRGFAHGYKSRDGQYGKPVEYGAVIFWRSRIKMSCIMPPPLNYDEGVTLVCEYSMKKNRHCLND